MTTQDSDIMTPLAWVNMMTSYRQPIYNQFGKYYDNMKLIFQQQYCSDKTLQTSTQFESFFVG